MIILLKTSKTRCAWTVYSYFIPLSKQHTAGVQNVLPSREHTPADACLLYTSDAADE